jgi:hypothetical protein
MLTRSISRAWLHSGAARADAADGMRASAGLLVKALCSSYPVCLRLAAALRFADQQMNAYVVSVAARPVAARSTARMVAGSVWPPRQ